MDDQIIQRLEAQGKKIDEVYRSVEKMRKYFMWTLIVSVAFIVLPLIGLMFAIPSFLNTLGSYQTLGL